MPNQYLLGLQTSSKDSDDTNMNFLNDAELAYTQITCKTFKSILYECASEILCQILSPRIHSNSNSAHARTGMTENEDGSESEHPKNDYQPISIRQEDVDLTYKMTRNIGARWLEKMVVPSEISRVLEMIVQNGDFLETDIDDMKELNSCNRSELQALSVAKKSSENEDIISEESSIDSNFSERISGSTRLQASAIDQVDRTRERERELNTSDQEAQTNQESLVQQLPYTNMLKVGQLDPCNVNSRTIENGTSSEWHPLPALTTSDPHIPNPSILIVEQIHTHGDDQLYGKPALEISKPMDVRKEIARIDDLANSIAINNETEVKRHGNTMWPHNWEIIQEQADKNNERLHPQKLRISSDVNEGVEDTEEIIEVIPRTLLGEDFFSSESNREFRDSSSRQNGEIQNGVAANDDLIFVDIDNGGEKTRMSTTKGFQKTWMSSMTRKRKLGNECEANTDRAERLLEGSPQQIVGKKPSDHSDRQWSSDQNKKELGYAVVKELEDTMIHEDEIGQEYDSCQGALKMIGNVHLWEQMKSKEWRGKSDDFSDENMELPQKNKQIIKLRKSMHRKAKRQRLYPNYEAGTKSYLDSKLASKVVRAEEGTEIGTRNSSIGLGYQCIELDLTDCIVSFLPQEKDKRKMLAFRSLEVSLSEDGK